MIRKIALMLLSVALLALAHPAAAQKEKRVGVGFILGEPTGVDVKFWLANAHALEFAAAWSLSHNDRFHLQGDYLFHKFDVFDITTGDDFPLFFGVGVRMIFREDPPGEDRDDILGIRFPVGLSYIFANYPFDIFGAIVPILDIVPDSDFDLEGAIGARFWF